MADEKCGKGVLDDPVSQREFYTCGGAGPGEGCTACEIWHEVTRGKPT